MYRVKFPDRYVARSSPAICFLFRNSFANATRSFRFSTSVIAAANWRTRASAAGFNLPVTVSNASSEVANRGNLVNDVPNKIKLLMESSTPRSMRDLTSRSCSRIHLSHSSGVAILLPGNSESAYFASIPRPSSNARNRTCGSFLFVWARPPSARSESTIASVHSDEAHSLLFLVTIASADRSLIVRMLKRTLESTLLAWLR